jgi:hypothetical protein
MVDQNPPARDGGGAPRPLGLERVSGRLLRALSVATILVLAFVAVCSYFGWFEDVAAWGQASVIAVALFAIGLYVVVTWLGGEAASLRGFRFGGEIYFGERWRSEANARSRRRTWIPVWAREPIIRLPVLVPIVCAAATFCTVHPSAGSRFSGQTFQRAAVTTLLVELVGLGALNAYLRAQRERTIDFLTAIVAVAALVGGMSVSLSGLAGPGTRHGVQLVSTAMIFGLVALVMSALRGADGLRGRTRSSATGAERTSRTSSSTRQGYLTASSFLPPRSPPPDRPRRQPPPNQAVTRDERAPSLAPPTALLWAVGAVVIVAGVLTLLAALLMVVSWTSSLRLHLWELGAVGFLTLSAGSGVALAKDPHGPKKGRYMVGLIGPALLSAICATGVTDAQNRLTPSMPECIALYSELADLVHQESPTIARAAAAHDPRYAACGRPLAKIEKAATSNGGQAPTPGPVSKPNPYPTPNPPTRSRPECVAFYVQLDDLVDDEPLWIARKAMSKDWRSDACEAPVADLAVR